MLSIAVLAEIAMRSCHRVSRGFGPIPAITPPGKGSRYYEMESQCEVNTCAGADANARDERSDLVRADMAPAVNPSCQPQRTRTSQRRPGKPAATLERESLMANSI